jgi:dephospho-CoA kinase
VPPPRTPVLVGLTGAVAAGKSEALASFARHGAATLSSDAVVHELLDDPVVRDRLVERWGSEVAPDGVVDRGRIGKLVFESPEELGWLEELLHPLVGERIAAWHSELDAATGVAVIEVPLLFETAMDGAFDETVAVVAGDQVRTERAGLRGTDQLDARAGRQLSQEEKAARAGHLIENDGSLEALDRSVAELMKALTPAGP